MKWFKKKPEEKPKNKTVSDAISLVLLKLSYDTVKNYGQKLRDQFNMEEQSSLPKIEAELLCFYIFSLDHWIQKMSNYSPEKQGLIRKAFRDQLASVVNVETLQQRLNAYGQIVNEVKDDTVVSESFDKKLSEFCGMPQDSRLLSLAPELFSQASEAISKIESIVPKS